MLLTDARRPARTGPHGELVSLPDQDRTLWNADLIAECTALITATLPSGKVGFYQLQATIAAIHDEAKTADATDWPQLLALYDLLARISTNPIVALNRAVALAMVAGPTAGLTQLDRLETQLRDSHRLHAARAHLLEMTGGTDAAIAHYQTAARLTTNQAEQDYLRMRAARLDPSAEAAKRPILVGTGERGRGSGSQESHRRHCLQTSERATAPV